MLVLERKIGKEDQDTILIGEGENTIEVKVIASKAGGVVRLGFNAPRHIRILRAEVTPRDEKDGQEDKGNYGKSYT